MASLKSNIASAFGVFAFSQLLIAICFIVLYARNKKYFEVVFHELDYLVIENCVLLLISGVTSAITCYQNERARTMFGVSLYLIIAIFVSNIFLAHKLRDFHSTTCSSNTVMALKEEGGHNNACQVFKQKRKELFFCVVAACINSFCIKICSLLGIAAVNCHNSVETQAQRSEDQEMIMR
uniref:Uncharacterized protein n=1 Tax=Clytia hemisphaerica TaxID=252671 RepID=A0A7M5U905_9CNID